MKSTWFAGGLMVVLLSCNNAEEKVSDNGENMVADSVTAAKPVVTDSTLTGCYAYVGGRDTVLLQVEKNGDNITGSLSYNYFEKDRNDGSIQGSISGDRISGFYLFKSEGVMSVRQEIWKISNGQLIPGSGEMIQRNDSLFFKDPAAVGFDEARSLKKKNCTT
ncbi:MAG: hypothetical protein ABWZ25_08195 [Chitinophagaceae bacterium]